MKKKDIDELRNKGIQTLQKEIYELRREIAKLQLDFKVNPPKDSNLAIKKRKKLAVMLTIINEKENYEKSIKT